MDEAPDVAAERGNVPLPAGRVRVEAPAEKSPDVVGESRPADREARRVDGAERADGRRRVADESFEEECGDREDVARRRRPGREEDLGGDVGRVGRAQRGIVQRGKEARREAESPDPRLPVVGDVDERGDEKAVRRAGDDLHGARGLERREEALGDEEGVLEGKA